MHCFLPAIRRPSGAVRRTECRLACTVVTPIWPIGALACLRRRRGDPGGIGTCRRHPSPATSRFGASSFGGPASTRSTSERSDGDNNEEAEDEKRKDECPEPSWSPRGVIHGAVSKGTATAAKPMVRAPSRSRHPNRSGNPISHIACTRPVGMNSRGSRPNQFSHCGSPQAVVWGSEATSRSQAAATTRR